MPKQKYHTDEERKAARKEARKKWASKNKERLSKYGKEYRKDPEVKKRYAELQKKWRENNPDRSKEIDNVCYFKTRQHNRVSRLLSSAKNRAKEKGLEFNLTPEDIVIPEYCPVFPHIKLERGNSRTRPELDRIDNSLGYVKGNVCVISGRANRLKADASIAELEAILAYCRP